MNGVGDNAKGADLQNKFKVWRNPVMSLKSLEASKVKAGKSVMAEVRAVYDMPEVKATLTLSYLVDAEGGIGLTEQLTVAGEGQPDMLRFGMVMDMPYNMGQSTFYGRGPVENYIDRDGGQWIGQYTLSAEQQFYPYIRPQETGTKCDIRWWQQGSNAADGLRLQPIGSWMDASALHYNISDLDEGDHKHQRHSPEIRKSKFTELCFDLVQYGLGGENSWGAWPLEKYRVHYGNKTFRVQISPAK